MSCEYARICLSFNYVELTTCSVEPYGLLLVMCTWHKPDGGNHWHWGYYQAHADISSSPG